MREDRAVKDRLRRQVERIGEKGGIDVEAEELPFAADGLGALNLRRIVERDFSLPRLKRFPVEPDSLMAAQIDAKNKLVVEMRRKSMSAAVRSILRSRY